MAEKAGAKPRDPKTPPPEGAANIPPGDEHLPDETKGNDTVAGGENQDVVVGKPTLAEGANQELGLAVGDREALFLSHLATAREDDALLEKAMEAVRGVRKRRTRNRNLCSTDGFSLKVMDEILADEVRPEEDVAKDAELRTEMRAYARQPVLGPAQRDLFDAIAPREPQGEKDEAYWNAKGFEVGFRGKQSGDPAEHGIPPGDPTQWWTAGWQNAQAHWGSKLKRAAEINEGRKEE